jgi:hypothetical protein
VDLSPARRFSPGAGVRLVAALLTALLIVLAPPLAITASACTYSNRRSIVIDYTKVGADNTGTLPATGFPVLVSLSGDWLKTTAVDPVNGRIESANGWDIVFKASDGTSALYHEIEKYDGTATGGTLVAWVRVDSLSKSADTTIYMDYGSACVSSATESPTDVWDTNFKGVYHLTENPAPTGALADSTANNYDGTNASTTNAGGVIGDGLDFSGSQYIDLGNNRDFATAGAAVTLSAWIQLDTMDDVTDEFAGYHGRRHR